MEAYETNINQGFSVIHFRYGLNCNSLGRVWPISFDLRTNFFKSNLANKTTADNRIFSFFHAHTFFPGFILSVGGGERFRRNFFVLRRWLIGGGYQQCTYYESKIEWEIENEWFGECETNLMYHSSFAQWLLVRQKWNYKLFGVKKREVTRGASRRYVMKRRKCNTKNNGVFELILHYPATRRQVPFCRHIFSLAKWRWLNNFSVRRLFFYSIWYIVAGFCHALVGLMQ